MLHARRRTFSFAPNRRGLWLAALALVAGTSVTGTAAGAGEPDGLAGDWSLRFASGTPGWMRVVEKNDGAQVFFRRYIGPDGPYDAVPAADGRLRFRVDRGRRQNVGTATSVDAGLKDGRLDGVLIRRLADGTEEREAFTGTRIPPMPDEAPDLSNVRFGHPIALFNGKDLTGWRPHEADKINGWSVEDGLLVNSTPKTDFSATGAHANLRTVEEFEDFWLHLEFLVEENRNSGVYLRGMYEAQVVDRDSRMQGEQGVGAIFGAIAPSENAGRPGGEWQTYDITLVDRHVTVVLNGTTVIDNQPISAPTAGAIYTDPSKPGPIYLQGDHTSVAFRQIYLAPVVRD
ncbi:3-keto-disaccharide hydrolase [Alienimonas chondri]|uniref:3-keto-alpha-glucoside-1,2-lyase/3-keto-2-hydroxy-glucal hydratase domain-containing protein n=1 Tax=Alienimonas chondri TaxID=2681879 RepID=A0ABX1VHW1_9PLAN|nr:DUF1080 domain-containing protein [Alienimonas chondri]NNJ27718.1 hypothetical protein [Alienimonas chondri]